VSNDHYTASAERFLSILSVVGRKPICTAYEVAKELDLPVSSTYQAINELERLSWLARDEDGYLLIGDVSQQIALSALGYDIVPRKLPPVIRYLRDVTGETVVVASLKEELRIGACLVGFNPNSVALAALQRYRVRTRTTLDRESGAMSLDIAVLDSEHPAPSHLHLMAVPLAHAAEPFTPGVLILGVCRHSKIINERETLLRFLEIRALIASEA